MVCGQDGRPQLGDGIVEVLGSLELCEALRLRIGLACSDTTLLRMARRENLLGTSIELNGLLEVSGAPQEPVPQGAKLSQVAQDCGLLWVVRGKLRSGLARSNCM